MAGDGTLYVADAAGFLRSFDPDGTERWNLSYEGEAVRSPAMTFDGRVYFPVGDTLVARGGEDVVVEGSLTECIIAYSVIGVAAAILIVLAIRYRRNAGQD